MLGVLLLFWSVVGGGSVPEAQAQTIKTEFQYAAKVTCSLLGSFDDGPLVNGIYRTVVNVHNPRDGRIRFARKVALAEPVGTDPGPFSVTPFKAATLGPDGAIRIDCGQIAGFFCPINGVCIDFTAIDGFLVLNSPVELDVVAVYTARSANGEVETIDVEAIQPRQIRKQIQIRAEEPPSEIKERIRR
jgi:hypothetical protein